MPYIAAPTSVTAVEPVTNPPTFNMNIVYTGAGAVEAGDIPQIQFDDTGTIYDGAAIVDPETDEPDFSGAGLPTLTAGFHTARIRFVRDEGGPGEIIGNWGTSNSFEIASTYTFSPPTYVDTKTTSADTTTPTYTGAGIGAADANRVIGLGFISRQTNSGDTISSVRVHTPDIATDPTGVLATHAPSTFGTSAGLLMSDIWYIEQSDLDDPTATTADVVVTWTANSQRSVLRTYRIVTETPAPTNGGNVAANAPGDTVQSLAATVPAGGGGMAIAGYRTASNSNDVSWTNATRDDPSVIQLETFTTVSSAHFSASATLGAQISGATNPFGDALSYASWDD